MKSKTKKVVRAVFTALTVVLTIAVLVFLSALWDFFTTSSPKLSARIGITGGVVAGLFCVVYGLKAIITRKLGESNTKTEAVVWGVILTLIGAAGLAASFLAFFLGFWY